MPRSLPRGMVWVVAEFGDLRDQLVRDGLRRLALTRYEVGPIPGGTWRTYAATSEDGRLIMLARDLGDLPKDQVRGVLMHELGHAADFLYPTRLHFQGFTPPGDVVLLDKKPSAAELKRWQRRSHDDVERFADQVAERAFGVRIGYRGECLLQSTAGGVRPRPRGLR